MNNSQIHYTKCQETGELKGRSIMGGIDSHNNIRVSVILQDKNGTSKYQGVTLSLKEAKKVYAFIGNAIKAIEKTETSVE